MKLLQNNYIKEYTDCQLRVGLIKWLIATFPETGRTHDKRFVRKAFEASLYQPHEGSTLVRHYFTLAKEKGVSPHLGIKDEPTLERLRRGGSRAILSDARRSAIDDILSWGCSIGFLDNRGVHSDFGLTKQGRVLKQIIGVDYVKEISRGDQNPLILTPIETGFFLLQELQQDCILLPLLLFIAEKFGVDRVFSRSSNDRMILVNLLQKSLKMLNDFFESTHDHRAQRDVSRHQALLADTIKTAKHRLTPRLEHLADYGFLQPNHTGKDEEDNDAEEYCWKLTDGGLAAAHFLKQTVFKTEADNLSSDSPNIRMPVMRDFLFDNGISFVASKDRMLTASLNNSTPNDILETLLQAYRVVSVRHGYSEFLSMAILAGLIALERTMIINISQYYEFLRRTVVHDPRLSQWIRLSTRFDPESLHLRIHKDAFQASMPDEL